MNITTTPNADPMSCTSVSAILRRPLVTVGAQHAAPLLATLSATSKFRFFLARFSAILPKSGPCLLRVPRRPFRRPLQPPIPRSTRFLFSLCLLSAPISRTQQPMQMPPSQQQAGEHHHGNISPVESHYPQMGRAQSAAQSQLLSLEQFQTLARENNPTLKQAEAEIRAANARRQQAGLYP